MSCLNACRKESIDDDDDDDGGEDLIDIQGLGGDI